MLNFSKRLIMASVCAAAVGACQANEGQASGLGDAARDSTLLEMKMFEVTGERSPALADLPRRFPVAIFNQKTTATDGTVSFAPIGFAINCKGRDPQAVIRAFGDSFLNLDEAEPVTEEILNEDLHLSEQPILRCDALNGQNQAAPLFSQIYRVIDRASQNVYHLVRFNDYSPKDKRLFELGCSNILDRFMNKDQQAIPVFKENLLDIPGADHLGSLHCFETASAPAQIRDLAYQAEPLPIVDDAQLYRVEDPERGLLRIVLSSGKAFRINCSATDGDLQKAWNVPVTGTMPTLTSGDAKFDAYVKGEVDAQPSLDCPSLSKPEFASDAYRLINQEGKPQPWLRLKRKADTLVQFGCESATQFFLKNPREPVLITAESSDVMVRSYVPGILQTKKYRIGCGEISKSARAAEVQKAFIHIFGIAADDTWIRQQAELIKTQQKTFRFQDIVAYFMSSMNVKEDVYEVNRIITRAYQVVYGRAPTASEKAPLVDRILKQKNLRPTFVDVVLDLKEQGCADCRRDALRLHIQDIEIAFLQVFGVPLNTAWAEQNLARIQAEQSSYQLVDIVDSFVNGMAMSDYEIGVITDRAFQGSRGRNPLADERAFFADYVLQQKKLRPHYGEVVTYLATIHDLPRDQLVQSYMDVMNESSAGGLKWWTTEMYSNPGKVYSYESVVGGHVAYLLGDGGKETLSRVVDSALQAALGKAPKPAWRDKVLNWIKKDAAVRAHYKELLAYIKLRKAEFI